MHRNSAERLNLISHHQHRWGLLQSLQLSLDLLLLLQAHCELLGVTSTTRRSGRPLGRSHVS